MNNKQILLHDLIKELHIFNRVYVNPLLDIMEQRKKLFSNASDNYSKINALTFSSVLIFFSFIGNISISIKRLINDAVEYGIIDINSNSKRIIVFKDEIKLSFNDEMKLTFSIFPSIFGVEDFYGAKNKEFESLNILRTVRNNIIHPKGIEDFLISLKELNGEDINIPIINYIESLKEMANLCHKKINID